jgi:hypothetical protein
MNKLEELTKYINDNELNVPSRKRELVDQRSYLYKHIRIEYGYSFIKIGKMFNKDHATIMHGINEYEKHKQNRGYLDNVFNLIKDYPIRSEMEVLTSALGRHKTIIIQLEHIQKLKLTKFRLDNELKTNEDAIKVLIDKIIKPIEL